ncbi:MAG: hypothetical protein ACR2QL_12870 [Woeseiaceae bacterium]
MTPDSPIPADEAKEALNTIDALQSASKKRAATPLWYGIGIALIITIGFSLYAQEDPGDFPGLFIVLGTALLVGYFNDKTGANARALPNTAFGALAFVAVVTFLLVLFFGGIYLRRAFDLPWVPVVTGLIAGATILWLCATERRGAGSRD